MKRSKVPGGACHARPKNRTKVLVTISMVLGFGYTAGVEADCFYYRSNRDATPEVKKHLSQGEEDSFQKHLSPRAYEDDYARGAGDRHKRIGYSAETERFFVRYDVWIPGNEYYIAEMISLFPPKIVAQSETAFLAESTEVDQDGQYVAELHISGRQAHEHGEGHVSIIFTTEHARETGDMSGRVIRVRYRNDVVGDWPGEKWIPYQSHLDQYGECEPARRPDWPQRIPPTPGGGGGGGGGGGSREPPTPGPNFDGLNSY